MMRRPRVKICGITRQSDAVAAVDLGADALGFIFWPRSPRAIAPETAYEIHASLAPLVTRVGVFVDMPPAEVAEVVRVARLDVVQLHGSESPAAYADVGARIVKSVSLVTADDVDRIADWPIEVTPLVDAVDTERRGGTGKVADWSLSARLAARRPIVLAGGLTADNIGAAVATVRPWAVDVSSGVEDAPGIKNAMRMSRFFASLQKALEEDV